MKTFKDKRRTHNRPVYGELWPYSGDKDRRKMMKAIRHKLLFHIPLTDEEKWIVEKTGLTATSQLDNRGGVKNGRYRWTDKWRYMNPKEERMDEIKRAEQEKYNYNKDIPKDENKDT